MLQLTRPLVVIDVESTGLDVANDRIVQLCLSKIFDFNEYPLRANKYVTNINPERPIPVFSTAIHGLTDSDVEHAPTFRAIAHEILTFLEGCDVAGFDSNRTDIPMLHYEFLRAGIDWKPGYQIDAGNLFKIKEPRTLSAAMQFYCRREHTNAHSAEGDVLATIDVLQAQLQRYDDLPDTIEELALLCNYGQRQADISGKFFYDASGVLCFNFGPHKGKDVRGYVDYLEWMQSKDFAPDTLRIVNDTLSQLYNALSDMHTDADDYSPF